MNVQYLKLGDGTQWANPGSAKASEIVHTLLHSKHPLTPKERMFAASLILSYNTLTHPCDFAVETAINKLRMLRRERKQQEEIE